MRALIKSIASDTVDIDNFSPADPNCFLLSLRIRIGNDEKSGADDFELCVCTPEWLQKTVEEPMWGRHMLIVRRYERMAIEKCIREYVEKCVGGEWCEVAEKISRNFAWEFEDYRE